jgi:hypothetical protein
MQIYGAVDEIIVRCWAAVQYVFVQDFYAFEAILVIPYRTIFREFTGLSQFFGEAFDEFHWFFIAPL